MHLAARAEKVEVTNQLLNELLSIADHKVTGFMWLKR